MNKIYLKNPGLLDLDFLKLMGCNVKESKDSIGMFGTGMKYAIAVCLREGIDLDLYIGNDLYTFYTETKTLRGKQFDVCAIKGPLDSIELGFTTELGKNWEPWMAYREIHSNCLDEKGVILHDKLSPSSGSTLFIIDDCDFGQVFLEPTLQPIATMGSLEVFKGESEFLFYQRIRARSNYALYTYNWKHKTLNLTEDRTLSTTYNYHREIIRFILNTGDEGYIRDIIENSGYMEQELDIATSGIDINEDGALFRLIDEYEYDQLPLNLRRYKKEIYDIEEEGEVTSSAKDKYEDISSHLWREYSIDLDDIDGQEGLTLADSLLKYLEDTE